MDGIDETTNVSLNDAQHDSMTGESDTTITLNQLSKPRVP